MGAERATRTTMKGRLAAVGGIGVALAVGLAAAMGAGDAVAGDRAEAPGARDRSGGPGVAVGRAGETLRARQGMVVSETRFASEIGARILERGGNAVDAAVATGFALAVTHPAAGNIGGGGFMVIRFPDGRATTVEFREKAPLGAHPTMFLAEDGEYSYEKHHDSHLSVGVPGTVAGFAEAHGAYGTGSWSRLVDPAVELARDGFPVSRRLAGSLERLLERVEGRYPATVAAFSRDGEPYSPGEILRQPDLASTLERIRDRGREGFYAGETARLVAAEMRRGGGLITEEDLARYEAHEREPIRGTYKGYEILSMPPPSSGGTALVEMLNILEGFDLASMGHGSADHYHVLAETMRRAYRDRARHLGDTDFVDVPLDRLTSKAHARRLRSTIRMDRAGTSDPADLEGATEGRHTTHYSVVDAGGLAVSVTYTLEQGYGSEIVVPGAGFLLNNEMGDFNPRLGLTTREGLIGTEANLVAPQKRMLSSMTPTIVARDGQLVAVVGSPGGRTIINTVLQVVLGVAEYGMGIQEAVDAPRAHHQWLPDLLRIEEGGASRGVRAELRARGHEVVVRGDQGLAHSIMIDPHSGERIGAPDPRSPDAAAAGH